MIALANHLSSRGMESDGQWLAKYEHTVTGH